MPALLLKRRSLWWLGLMALLALACPSTPPATKDAASFADAGDSDIQDLSDPEAQDLADIIATAKQKRVWTIPDALLTDDDREYQNDFVAELLDGGGQRVGFLRDVFTPVHCSSGVCRAIHFALVYRADQSFLAIYHPSNRAHDLMKYWDGEHRPFDAADWETLHAILRDPPAVLVGLQDSEDLVADATETAPTVLGYQASVVRGAAFTTYDVLHIHLRTRQILAELFGDPS